MSMNRTKDILTPSGYYSSMNGKMAIGGLPDPQWYEGDIQWIPRIKTTRAAVSYGGRGNIRGDAEILMACPFAGVLGCCCRQCQC
jgi:hypothetical protein